MGAMANRSYNSQCRLCIGEGDISGHAFRASVLVGQLQLDGFSLSVAFHGPLLFRRVHRARPAFTMMEMLSCAA